MRGENAREAARRLDTAQPSAAQLKYLKRGLEQAAGKLPLFDDEGREIDARTIRACIKAGWAEPWFANAMKPDWLVCKLTGKGRDVFGAPADGAC